MDPSNCNYACCADGSVACGGFWFLSVYAANATNNSGFAPTQTPSVTSNNKFAPTQTPSFTNHSGNNPNNATNYGSNDSQPNKNIALGTGIGIGVLGVILSAILVIIKRSKKGHNPEQSAFQQSSEMSSTRSLYEVAGHNPEQNAFQQLNEMSSNRSLYEVAASTLSQPAKTE